MSPGIRDKQGAFDRPLYLLEALNDALINGNLIKRSYVVLDPRFVNDGVN
jgi:hypothetical protein